MTHYLDVGYRHTLISSLINIVVEADRVERALKISVLMPVDPINVLIHLAIEQGLTDF